MTNQEALAEIHAERMAEMLETWEADDQRYLAWEGLTLATGD